ncbi:hypothetical protein KIW84_033501 [Lathyrus oleraceus]|uniref:Arabidopsis retrotransposon Orf1 C-terminal domain-containing protein n=1 Tax=Pisum sativum TaxID=3888 RepID=A0A9D4XX17_PEA|nr:hypothetical protein KIW84_033501 [Pisum sativum]
MPPRAVRPGEDMDYMEIAFAEGIDGENQRRRYHKLFKRDVLATRYPDNAALRDLGLSDNVHWMLNNLGMSHFLTLTSPTYIRLTYEFLSSFRYTTPIGGFRTTDIVHFRMFNRSYAINQDQLADLLLFPRGDEFACQHTLEREWESNTLDFWQQLMGKTTTDWEGLKATAIQNPTIHMRLIKNKPNGKYFLLITNREVRGVTLPCTACINVRMSTNWTFDLNAPEPDHMEQDTPHTGTHARTAPTFPDSFTSTSSGYQSREEYDYTTMRTTLADRQQEEMRVSVDQIRQTQLDFIERTELNMDDLIENMNGVHMEVAGMREYIQHVPSPAFDRGGFA